MTDRDRALDLLRQARDLLTERLTQRILESGEQLLDDARGDSYLGDIEAIYEQFGMKLSHLNQLLNNLPPDTTSSTSTHTSYTTSHDTFQASSLELPLVEDLSPQHPPAMIGPLIVSPPALPAPRTAEAELLPPNFHMFAAQMREGDVLAAGKTLGYLLDLSEARGVQCARVFHRRWQEDAAFLPKAMQLRNEVNSGGFNNALVLLAECFGLLGIEAIGALQTLRSRYLGP